jgi:hypothetical protein
VRKRLARLAMGNEDEWHGNFIEVWAQTASCSFSESHHILVSFTIVSPYVALTAQSYSWMRNGRCFRKILVCALVYIITVSGAAPRADMERRYGYIYNT